MSDSEIFSIGPEAVLGPRSPEQPILWLAEEVRRLRSMIHDTADVGIRVAVEAEAYRQALTLIASGISNPEAVARAVLQLSDSAHPPHRNSPEG